MDDTPRNNSDQDVLLKFPLATFFRLEFMEDAIRRRKDKNFRISKVPFLVLMGMVGQMCAEKEFTNSGRQPVVGDLIKMTRHQVQSYHGLGPDRFQFLEYYLSLFGLHLADMASPNTNIGEAENRILSLVQEKES